MGKCPEVNFDGIWSQKSGRGAFIRVRVFIKINLVDCFCIFNSRM